VEVLSKTKTEAETETETHTDAEYATNADAEAEAEADSSAGVDADSGAGAACPTRSLLAEAMLPPLEPATDNAVDHVVNSLPCVEHGISGGKATLHSHYVG